jgi:hypothetical protein
LDLNLYAEVSYSQGTNSDPRTHLGRGNKPAGGPIISSLLLVVVDLSRSLAA